MLKNCDYGVGILGVGHYIPSIEISNKTIEENTGLSATSIIEKTGIESRFIAGNNEPASEMSVRASQAALCMAKVLPEQLGQIICCSFSGDYVYPAMACKVQDCLGARNAGAFDVMANCTGFQVGLGVLSNQMFCNKDIEYGLAIGTAVQSPYITWNQPEIAMYFGDGAGAAVLGKVPPEYGILSSEIISNGRVFESVRLRGGGSSYPLRSENIDIGLQYYEMDGLEVWKQLIQHQPRVIRQALTKINMSTQDVDFFIFHQANLRLIEYLMAKMKQPMSKTHVTVERFGNTADASLAITLSDAVQKGKIKRDQIVVVSGVGAGFIFGATVLRWY